MTSRLPESTRGPADVVCHRFGGSKHVDLHLYLLILRALEGELGEHLRTRVGRDDLSDGGVEYANR